jgi:hypothetical protein
MIAPDDWETRSRAFVEHVAYLIPDAREAGTFLMWLAHMLQRPGELPHSYYCLISQRHGTGRNWLASVLGRVLHGYVTPSIDLGALLRTGFNGALSRKLLAVVDEAHEAMDGGNRYANARALRGMITEEYRLINPKYAPQHVEKNAVRWLMFSNYADPLPVDEEDRRGNFISGPTEPRDASYYTRLYQTLLPDEAFIASVGRYLQTLDISAYNPGAHSVRNAARAGAIAAGLSDVDRILSDFVADYTGDVVSTVYVQKCVLDQSGGRDIKTRAIDHACRRAGLHTTDRAIRVHVGGVRTRLLRVGARMSAADFADAAGTTSGLALLREHAEQCEALHAKM